MTNFRMSKSTFEFICQELEKEIENNDTVMLLSIPIKMRVAVTLWFRRHQYD